MSSEHSIGSNDNSTQLLEQVSQATANLTPLRIVGGNSKSMLGNQHIEPEQRTLSTIGHSGIINYDPTELVISVRAGTPLVQLNRALADAGQMLPFEPPERVGCTIGGILACGLSGPRRPFSGSARDYVLGVRTISGLAQDLSFGGEVMKNVAGYDVSRLQVGAWGTLGVLLDVSMKVLPLPELELTVMQECNENAPVSFAPLLRMPLPVSGAMRIGSHRYIRLSGSDAAVRAAAAQLGGDVLEDNDIWRAVRDHDHEFFTSASNAVATQGKSLWRVSVADFHPELELSGECLHEWGGGQRWIVTSEPADEIFSKVDKAGGHAMRYGGGDASEPAFQPMTGAMKRLQTRVRDSFDPSRLFNRGRFHPELDVAQQAHTAGD